MYSQKFDAKRLKSFFQEAAMTDSEIKRPLEPPLTLRQVAKLINACSQDDVIELVIEGAQATRAARWQNRLFLMPPLYISDGDPIRGGCLDHCVYCPWRNGNVPQEKIRRLSELEVTKETSHLLSLGYGDVELVAATDPELLKAKQAAKLIASAKSAGAEHIGINLFPLLHADDYAELSSAGCTFAIVWQETYDETTYREMHPKGPKANFNYRLDAHDRALLGGIKTVGLAFLGGLAGWKLDTLATIAHAQYLKQEYNANIIFGMPRWKNGAGIPMKVASDFYGDREFEFVGALYSLAIPDSLPWFSTREHFDLSARCAKGGGCIFTLDCSTEVGGYTNKGGFAQFPVYTRSFNEGVAWLREVGFAPQIHLPW